MRKAKRIITTQRKPCTKRKAKPIRKPRKPKHDFTVRYADNWISAIIPVARRATNYHCCHCLKRFNVKRLQVHHTSYRHEKGTNASIDEIGTRFFPVCKPCHRKLHKRDRWHWDTVDPVLGNHNAPEIVAILQANYQKLVESVNQ